MGDTYVADDPARMCRALPQSKKPCLGFKMMGMFPKYSDQVAENAGRARVESSIV